MLFYKFYLPERINIIAAYNSDFSFGKIKKINYLAQYKRQGDVNFYYAGVEFSKSESQIKVLLDIENIAPEIQYSNQWLDFIIAIDHLNIQKTMQFKTGISFRYHF